MSARDYYHAAVRKALRADGWTITHDPYTMTFGQRGVFVDLGAEKPIAAERHGVRIAVEIKSFIGASDIRDLEVALGQFVFYRALIARVEADRKLFLAIPQSAFAGVFTDAIARPALDDINVPILVIDVDREVVLRWIP